GIKAKFPKTLLAAPNILKRVADRLYFRRTCWSRCHLVEINRLERRLEGGQHILMRVSHEPIGQLALVLPETVRELDLIPHQRHFASEMEMDVGGATIGTKQRNGEDAVITAALVADKFT